jgi:hypothetical protein
MAVHEVIPATVASSTAGDDLHVDDFALDAIDLPAALAPLVSVHVLQVDSGCPPNDLVVTLQRLII